MPEIKANEALPERPAVILIFGDPGVGKTSLAATCYKPYTIDFDKGLSRASRRGDALLPDNWEEVLEHEKKGTFKKYSTIVIDTAKACLDDFLMTYVVNLDYKNKKNKQAAYGALGDEFKVFLSNRRIDSSDILIIAHAKDKEDGDLTRKIPDVTGGSYQLLLRVADQVGFMTTRNNRRVIQFEPTDNSIGKNVAKLPTIEVPAESDPAFRTFMAGIFQAVKDSIRRESEDQAEATKLSEKYQGLIDEAADLDQLDVVAQEISALDPHLALPLSKLVDQRTVTFVSAMIGEAETPEYLSEILEQVNQLPEGAKMPLRKLINTKAKERGYVPNIQTKKFELPACAGPTTPVTPAKEEKPAEQPAVEQPEEDHSTLFVTEFDDRVKMLETIGMRVDSDQVSGFDLSFTMEQIGDWTEDQFIDMVSQVNSARKTPKRAAGRKATAAVR